MTTHDRSPRDSEHGPYPDASPHDGLPTTGGPCARQHQLCVAWPGTDSGPSSPPGDRTAPRSGPSPLDWSRRTHFITPADAAPAEYIPYGLRPFTGADLVAERPGEERGVWWRFSGATADGDRALRLVFTDETLGLEAALCYETVPGTDVILRWTELTCTGDTALRLERFDSAAVNIPAANGARLTYLTGQWSQEFQLTQLELTRGRFEMASTQAVPGHAYAPWLAVQDAAHPAEGCHAHLRHRPGVVR